ncbi:MAG: hypothetical protein U0168_12420 [Nannocystaceae bacterium]
MTKTSASTLLLALAACGPAFSGDDDGGSSGGMQQCVWGTMLYDDGDEFETPDGCVKYRCDSGALVALQDSRIHVAGDLELATQAEVDAQACLGSVGGQLRISGGAADLTPLSSLANVGGTLVVDGAAVVTLDGLQALVQIDGALQLTANPGLTTLAFHPYLSVFGDLVIEDNDTLASLDGAEFLSGCTGCAIAGDVADGTGPDGGALSAGDQAPTGGVFYGNISIADNDVLVDLSAMTNLVSAWADLRLSNNAQLASLSALQLGNVGGDLEIADNVTLPDADVQALLARVAVAGTTTVCGNQGEPAC